jgi:hypothetical protein
VIEENVTGIMFPHGDYTALESALLRLTEDPALRMQVGARSKDTVFKRHTWAANARFVVQLAGGESPARQFAQMEQLN